MFVDTHTHLYSEEFNSDRTHIIKKAISSGVKKLYLPNIDSTSIEAVDFFGLSVNVARTSGVVETYDAGMNMLFIAEVLSA